MSEAAKGPNSIEEYVEGYDDGNKQDGGLKAVILNAWKEAKTEAWTAKNNNTPVSMITITVRNETAGKKIGDKDFSIQTKPEDVASAVFSWLDSECGGAFTGQLRASIHPIGKSSLKIDGYQRKIVLSSGVDGSLPGLTGGADLIRIVLGSMNTQQQQLLQSHNQLAQQLVNASHVNNQGSMLSAALVREFGNALRLLIEIGQKIGDQGIIAKIGTFLTGMAPALLPPELRAGAQKMLEADKKEEKKAEEKPLDYGVAFQKNGTVTAPKPPGIEPEKEDELTEADVERLKRLAKKDPAKAMRLGQEIMANM